MENIDIKFRCWYSGSKTMGEPFYLDSLTHPNGIGYLGETINGSFVEGKILRYIGLVDDTGEEIYEGDILIDDIYPEDGISYSEIFWDNENGQWLDRHWGVPFKEFSDYRVVGNVYENPDLVKSFSSEEES